MTAFSDLSVDIKDEPADNGSSSLKGLSLFGVCLIVTAYAFSYGPISWLLLSEMFPDKARGRAVSFATTFNWLGNLVVSLTFLPLTGVHSHKT